MTLLTSSLRLLSPISLLALLGCPSPQRLPDCVATSPAREITPEEKADLGPEPALVAPTKATNLMAGIDGSGSMLGLVQASDPSAWGKLLQAINLAAQTEGLGIQAFRIGGNEPIPFGKGSVTPAVDPCFFQGCGPFSPPVASGLQTLWTSEPATKKVLPLRLIVSDLEVNQSDISQLVAGMRGDLARGAGAGILGLRLPFEGSVFDSQGKVIHVGKADRPIYLLATGQPSQVDDLLKQIRDIVATKGINAEMHLSILSPQSDDNPRTLLARDVQILPYTAGTVGLPVQLGGARYSANANTEYRFVTLKAGRAGNDEQVSVVISTIPGLKDGATRSGPGLVRIESVPIIGGTGGAVSGVQIEELKFMGTHLQARLGIDQNTPSGLLRAVIPRGAMPESWWINWDRSSMPETPPHNQTDGLLLLLTTLGQQLPHSAITPAAALCLALQN